MSTDNAQANKTANKKSAIVGITTLVAGVLIGLTAMKYVAGKSTAMAATKTPKGTAAKPSPKDGGPLEWNPFQELRTMQLHMDQMFDAMTTQFRMEPRLDVFSETPGYSLSLHVQDLKDRFEVRAYLPDAKASDVNVSLPNSQTLKVEVSNKNTESTGPKIGGTQVTEWGQYSQTIQLPKAVKTERMKIDQENHELLITLPKA